MEAEAQAPRDLAVGEAGRGELVRAHSGPDPPGVDPDEARLLERLAPVPDNDYLFYMHATESVF